MRKYRKFVVGYPTDKNCVYGREYIQCPGCGITSPLTITEARKLLTMLHEPSKAIIYELVPVKSKEKK